MHCPTFIYDIAVARAASEFLGSEMGLEVFASKYANGLSETYNEISQETIEEPAESIMQFLAEIEAGELAVELLTDFIHYRLFFDGVGRPRKMKPLFGSIEDGVKVAELNPAEAAKSFRAYVFALRSNTVPKAPSGWQLENEPHLPKFRELVGQTVSVLDIL